MVMSFCGFPMIDFYQDHGLLSAAHVLITQSMYAEVDLGLLQAVNYYHKALHLECCSSPRSASGTYCLSNIPLFRFVRAKLFTFTVPMSFTF